MRSFPHKSLLDVLQAYLVFGSDNNIATVAQLLAVTEMN